MSSIFLFYSFQKHSTPCQLLPLHPPRNSHFSTTGNQKCVVVTVQTSKSRRYCKFVITEEVLQVLTFPSSSNNKLIHLTNTTQLYTVTAHIRIFVPDFGQQFITIKLKWFSSFCGPLECVSLFWERSSVVQGQRAGLLVPKFAGSNPAEAVGFLRTKKSSARLPSDGK